MTQPRDKMRVSVDSRDPGYRVDWFRFEALLDGVPQPDARTADEEKGIIVRIVRDAKGNPVQDDNFRLVTETVHGNVEIRLKKEYRS